jgi:hypothetical protein
MRARLRPRARLQPMKLRPFARLIVGSIVITVAVAAAGVLVAVLRDSDVRESVALALWIGGAVVLLVVGLAGSPSRNLVEGRSELGGRMIGVPLAQSPFGFAITGFVLVAAGFVAYFVG